MDPFLKLLSLFSSLSWPRNLEMMILLSFPGVEVLLFLFFPCFSLSVLVSWGYMSSGPLTKSHVILYTVSESFRRDSASLIHGHGSSCSASVPRLRLPGIVRPPLKWSRSPLCSTIQRTMLLRASVRTITALAIRSCDLLRRPLRVR